MHITSSELTVERFCVQNKMLKICLCKYLNVVTKMQCIFRVCLLKCFLLSAHEVCGKPHCALF